MLSFRIMSEIKLRRLGLLGLTTALASVGYLPAIVQAQDCTLIDGEVPEGCKFEGAGLVITTPVGANVEGNDVPDLGVDGFEISVDGAPVATSGVVQKTARTKASVQRKQDVALAKAEVGVKFDGLDIQPRLDVNTVGSKTVYSAGDAVTFKNTNNYPAFVQRGEVRIIDTNDRGGAKTIAVLPLAPNEMATTRIPAGEGLVYVYRVYDAQGRYDETLPAALTTPSRRGLADDAEEGTDATAKRRIPLNGGSVTVYGSNVRSNVTVNTMGETIRADRNGKFVLQRILPAGDHKVDVNVAAGPKLERDITIPANDLFYIGLVDLTIGKSLKNDLEDATGENYDDVYTRGRIAFYLKGKVKGEYLVTAAVDTGEDELKNLLRNLDEKDPRSLLNRIDPNEYYPVYGDDSTAVETAPTSGKLFVRVERYGSHLMWGDFKSQIQGTEYMRNERTLYGAQAVLRSLDQTGKGEARFEIQAHAAQPDTLPRRDVFLGTGGSTYFLRYQDITRGSETLLIEVRDPTTGRVLERRTLAYGTDYDINYLQGLIILTSPLSGSGSDGSLISTNPNGDNETYLVANYEHTPTLTDADTFSYGARVQGWATDNLRFGASYLSEDTGNGKQEAYGVDALYQVSEQTFVELEFAKTEGPGFGNSISTDGGLIITDTAAVAGNGQAVRVKAQASLTDLGFTTNGVIGGYYEDRSAGFSTLSYQTSSAEQLWGMYADVDLTSQTSLRFHHDEYTADNGNFDKETGLEVTYKQNEQLTWKIGVEDIDVSNLTDTTKTGQRTDLGIRVTYDPNEKYSVYGFGQATVRRSGGLTKNNRLGFGGEWQVKENWRLSAEVSDGSTGFGARAYATYERDENNSYYFGYTLDPDREFGGVALAGRDSGSFVIGARRKLSDSVNVYGENTYDLFGSHKSLTSVYGAEYAYSDFLSFSGALEVGQIRDDVNGDFDRHAVSFSVAYKDVDLDLRARLEYRQDEGQTSGTNRDSDTYLASISGRYKIDEEQRFLASLETVYSDNAQESVPDARFAEAIIGYAYRPINDDRLNVLAKYQYLYDMTERTGTVTSATQPRQKAHILSVDASYDINKNWSVGGKVGGRWSSQSSGADGSFVSNNATLGVLNLRYHMVHEWDALLEVRSLTSQDVGTQTGVLAAMYKHVGNNVKVGVGYNFGKFSDDLSDVTYDDSGVFLNIIAKF